MLRYRDYKEHTASRSSRVWTAFATALGFVVVPILRLLCRLIPPLGRAIRNTSAGRMGVAFRTRDRGDHREAFALAMEGLARCRFAPGTQRAEFMADLNWWTFLDVAAHEAQHLGDAERAQVAQALDAAPAPGGMLAASCMCRVARWRWIGGDRDGAIRLAREAIMADSSSVDGHVLLGWYGLVTGRFDPLPHLRRALEVDPACRETICTNPDFANAPGLLRSLAIEGGQ
jgi:hypothetical protein